MNGNAASPAESAAGAREASGVVDLLIVGGGPAGAAAALRGLELGLALRVLDYDDLLKRIRDYPKDKKILPDFGGGDKMRFPHGGDLVAGLQFDPIDKDALCEQVKTLFRQHTVPVSIAVELTSLERGKDGVYTAIGWDHGQRSERHYQARHVALALGRGVPRRFDIPGNTDGIAYRLSDAAAYVGAPALVIGGGT